MALLCCLSLGRGKSKDEKTTEAARMPQRAFPFEFAYTDAWLLADELDIIYGPGKYQLESSNDRYILRAPRDLKEHEKKRLLERARNFHPDHLSSDSSEEE